MAEYLSSLRQKSDNIVYKGSNCQRLSSLSYCCWMQYLGLNNQNKVSEFSAILMAHYD